MRRVFVTGASGFVGARACAELRARGHHVIGLRRASADLACDVIGDLTSASTYAPALTGVDVVVHLAAVTGKANPAEYIRVNVDGTSALVGAARAAGVTRFLLCSSIAVGFPDRRRYFYAESKAAAERIVAASGLRYATLRPTIVAGEGSPVMSRLASLASLPLVPAIGGARARVQPIHVIDLAALIADIIDTDRFHGETLDLGGHDILPLRDLLDRLHRHARQRPAKFFAVPMGLILPIVRVAESLAPKAVPITVGQLATFRFDGIATPNDLWEARRPRLVSLDRIVEDSVRVRLDSRTLERECRVFTRFMTRQVPTPYVYGQYAGVHRIRDLTPRDAMDRLLVRVARWSPVMTRIADGYARLATPRCTLRRKLVALLAILEVSSPFHRSIDDAPTSTVLGALASLAATGVAGAAAGAVGLLVFAPVHLVLSVWRRRS